jgi:PhzF family phenazine biosynthesis protein
VDAFADHPFTGNPAAVMPLEQWLPDEILQAIAMENNLSETAFTIPAKDGEADYELRWFTPAVEVALCGHATLASGHVLIGDRERVRFRTRKAGLLEVARGEDGAYLMSLPAYRAEPKPLPKVVAALGCDPQETLWHSGLYALIVLGSEEEVLALRPDFRALGKRAISSPSSPRPAKRATSSAASSPAVPASTRIR